MKKAPLLLFLLMVFFVGCVGSVGPNKAPIRSDQAAPLLVTETARIEYVDFIPGGGEKVELPANVVRLIANGLLVKSAINAKHKNKLIALLEKFFPSGGMLTLTDSKNETNNFGLAYYKESNSVKVTFLAKGEEIKYLLNADKSLKKKVVIKAQ